MRISKKLLLIPLLFIMTVGCEWDRNMNYGHRRRHMFFRTSRAMFSPLDTLNVDEATIRDLESIRYNKPNLKYYTAPNWMAKMSHTPEVEKLALYTLEPGSSFRLDIDGEEEISKTYVVGPDGNIEIPLVKKPIHLSGLTYEESKALITKNLKTYIKNPLVNTNAVLIKRDETDVYSTGEAIMLGAYGGTDSIRGTGLDNGRTDTPNGVPARIINLEGESTFLKSIAIAGGVKGDADMQNIVVLREINNELNVIVCDFQRLTQFGDMAQNIRILKGDIIYVPLRENSFGEQFNYEWNTVLRYLGGLITWDFALEQFKNNGRFR